MPSTGQETEQGAVLTPGQGNDLQEPLVGSVTQHTLQQDLEEEDDKLVKCCLWLRHKCGDSGRLGYRQGRALLILVFTVAVLSQLGWVVLCVAWDRSLYALWSSPIYSGIGLLVLLRLAVQVLQPLPEASAQCAADVRSAERVYEAVGWVYSTLLWCTVCGFILATAFNSTPIIIQAVSAFAAPEPQHRVIADYLDAVPAVATPGRRRLQQTHWGTLGGMGHSLSHSTISFASVEIAGVLVCALVLVPLCLCSMLYLTGLYGDRMRAHADGVALLDLTVVAEPGDGDADSTPALQQLLEANAAAQTDANSPL